MRVMPRYRLYFINPTPRHIRDIVDFESEDDVAAVHHATALADGRAMELWRGEQVVKVYDRNDPS